MIEWRRRGFLPGFLAEILFTIQVVLIKAVADNRKLSIEVVWPFRTKWTVDTLPQGKKLFFECKLRLLAAIISRRKA
jgi:hypothetical protein